MRLKTFNEHNSSNYEQLIIDELLRHDEEFGDDNFFFTKPIAAGDVDGKYAYCNHVHLGSFDSKNGYVENGLVLNLIWDKKYDELYEGDTWKWTYATSDDIEDGSTTYHTIEGNKRNIDITLFNDIYEKIYKKLKDPKEVEVNNEYRSIRSKCHELIYTKDKNKDENLKSLDSLILFRKKAYYEGWLSDARPESKAKREYEDILTWTEEDYQNHLEEERKQSEMFKSIWDKISKDL